METREIKAEDQDIGQRLDKVLVRHLPDFSRARLQALMDEGRVTLAALPCKPSYKVCVDEVFTVVIPPPVDAEPQAEDIALEIVFEDEHMLVINKQAGMVVHPAAGNHAGTLVNALLGYCGDELSGIGGVKRPGIVHRLDKETSGLMAVAKTDAAHQGLSAQLSDRTLKRVYQAVVWGVPAPAHGRIETQIGRSKTNRKKMAVLEGDAGKEAVTDYSVLKTFGLIASLVECRLQTGRTHQIRVHMAHRGHWLIGDPVYGRPSPQKFLKLQKTPEKLSETLLSFPRQALHAAQLEFIHPISKNKISLDAPLPPDIQALLDSLEKK